MLVDVIEDFETFSRIKSNWEAVYEADPEAQFFLSWNWLSNWITQLTNSWFILAARSAHDPSKYVAFFPLRLRTKEKNQGVGFYNELNMIGNYAADYTGFICVPEYQDFAIPLFASHLQTMNWTRINLEFFRVSDRRMKLFLQAFSEKNFATKQVQRINTLDNIDNCICPAATLPNDFDVYLNGLSSNTRQKARRFLRQLDDSTELRITHGVPDTADRDLKILLKFWAQKWGSRKGRRLPTLVRGNFKLLKRFAERELLFLPVLWKGDTPLGALATFIDDRKRALLFYIGARDESVNNPPPGFLLHAYSIRYAIQNGFTTYDFLRGNEAYKYSFGAVERRIRCVILSTKSNKNLGNVLDPRSFGAVLKRSTELHKSGEAAKAERGYRQLLDVNPRDTSTLYRFAQLMETQGKHNTAKRAFQTLVEIYPSSAKAWLGLARTLIARSKFRDAARAYGEVVKQSPDLAVAHCNLGYVLLRLNEVDEALESLRRALDLQSDNAKAQSLWSATVARAAMRFPAKRDQYAAMSACLGDAMREKKQLAFAVSCYRHSLDLQPGMAAAHFGLGQALRAQGDTENATRCYEAALSFEPRHLDALKAWDAFRPSN